MDERLGVEIRLAGEGADAEGAVLLPHVAEPVDAVDIDEMTRLRQPEAHQGNEALAAGQDLGVIAKFPEQRDGLGERRRGVVREFARDHGHSSPDNCVYSAMSSLVAGILQEPESGVGSGESDVSPESGVRSQELGGCSSRGLSSAVNSAIR